MSKRTFRAVGSIRSLAVSCLLGLAAFTGCGSGVGPLVPVEGKAKVDGQPLTGGQVTFVSTDGGDSKLAITGSVHSDGTYTMSTNGNPGVPKGKYKVMVNTMAAASSQGVGADPSKMTSTPTAAPPPQRAANIKYETADKTDLTVEVPGSYDLNLTK